MKKNKTSKRSYRDLSFKNLQWCIDNDFQVYVKPLTVESPEPVYNRVGQKISDTTHTMTGEYKIAVRRNGISSEGRDYIKKNGRVVKSKETLSEKTYSKEADAFKDLGYVYNQLRRKYG